MKTAVRRAWRQRTLRPGSSALLVKEAPFRQHLFFGAGLRLSARQDGRPARDRQGVRSIDIVTLLVAGGGGAHQVTHKGIVADLSKGSDHQSFSARGVPGFMLVQDMSTYTYTHHTPADTLDAANEANLIQRAQTMAVTAMRIANLEALLPRVPIATRRR